MNKGGRYRQKSKRSRKSIPAMVFFLIVIVGLLIISAGIHRTACDNTGYTEPKPTNPVQSVQQTFPTEATLPTQVQATETTDHTQPPVTETTVAETIETEAIAESIQETQTENRTVPEDIPEGYALVLEQYREVMMMDSSEFFELHGPEKELDIKLAVDALQTLVDNNELESVLQILEQPTLSERYPFVNGSTFESFHSAKMSGESKYCDPMLYHYAYYNIDNSRSDELLIAKYDDYYDEYTILAIYTHSDAGPNLLESLRDDSRWHLTIYTDGTICLDGSGGASLHHWYYYRMHDVFDELDLIASFSISYGSPRSEYLISAAEDYESALTPVENIVWYPLMKE